MKTRSLTLLAILVAGCHFDKLINATSGAARLAFVTQPATGTAGTPLSTVRVAAEDNQGAVVSSFGDAVTVHLRANPGGATLSATVTAVNGVATFSTLEVDKAAQGYELIATTSSSGLAEDTSSTFDVEPGPVSALVFTVEPSNTPAGAKITPPVEVTAFDGFGNQATAFTGTVSIDIGRNGGLVTTGNLSGTRTVPAVNGVARFSNLSIDAAGNGYTLMTNITGVNKESTSFNVTVL